MEAPSEKAPTSQSRTLLPLEAPGSADGPSSFQDRGRTAGRVGATLEPEHSLNLGRRKNRFTSSGRPRPGGEVIRRQGSGSRADRPWSRPRTTAALKAGLD